MECMQAVHYIYSGGTRGSEGLTHTDTVSFACQFENPNRPVFSRTLAPPPPPPPPLQQFLDPPPHYTERFNFFILILMVFINPMLTLFDKTYENLNNILEDILYRYLHCCLVAGNVNTNNRVALNHTDRSRKKNLKCGVCTRATIQIYLGHKVYKHNKRTLETQIPWELWEYPFCSSIQRCTEAEEAILRCFPQLGLSVLV